MIRAARLRGVVEATLGGFEDEEEDVVEEREEEEEKEEERERGREEEGQKVVGGASLVVVCGVPSKGKCSAGREGLEFWFTMLSNARAGDRRKLFDAAQHQLGQPGDILFMIVKRAFVYEALGRQRNRTKGVHTILWNAEELLTWE